MFTIFVFYPFSLNFSHHSSSSVLWFVRFFIFLIVKHGAIIYDTIPLHERIVKRESEEKGRDGTTC